MLLDSESNELKALVDSSQLIKDIQKLTDSQFPDYSPSFEALIKILSWFDKDTPIALQKYGLVNPKNLEIKTTSSLSQDDSQTQNVEENNGANILNFSYDAVSGRNQAQGLIRQARLWFIQNEPSSPVVLLLQKAEGLIGKPFEDVFQAIPADLIELWHSTDSEASN